MDNPKITHLSTPVKIALQAISLWVIFFSFIGLLWGIKTIFNTLENILLPIITAGILSCLLKPLIDFFHKTCKIKSIFIIGLIYICIIASFILLIWLILPAFMNQCIGFINNLPILSQRLMNTYYTLIENPIFLNFNQIVSEQFQGLKPEMIAQNLLINLQKTTHGFYTSLEIIINWCLMPIYLFYFLLSPGQFMQIATRQLTFLKPTLRSDILFLYEEFIQILIAFFRGQLLISLILSSILSISFSLIGLQYGALIGFITGLLNIFPYIGTIVGLLISVPIAYLQLNGGPILTTYVVSIFTLTHILESYFLSPKIIGQKTGLHPAVIIFSLFFWGKILGGMIGLLLAVPLSAFWVTIWRLLKNKYLPQFKDDIISITD